MSAVIPFPRRSATMLTQKDLMERWRYDSVRNIQRIRKEFGLEPSDFTGITPLFALEDVQRVEEARREKRMKILERCQSQRRAANILTLKEIRAREGKRKAKR